MTRIYLHHRIVDTDQSASEAVEKSWPLTGRGVAAAWRQYQADLKWLRRNFGPGTILPRHQFSLRIAEPNGEWKQAELGSPRDQFDVSEDIANLLQLHDRWRDVAQSLA
jgi:hypothetical protein